jgi:hypothetical protein
MSNFFALDELAKSRQQDLRQEAKYAAQLREMSAGLHPSWVRSHWKLAVALGAAVLIAVLAALNSGVVS